MWQEIFEENNGQNFSKFDENSFLSSKIPKQSKHEGNYKNVHCNQVAGNLTNSQKQKPTTRRATQTELQRNSHQKLCDQRGRNAIKAPEGEDFSLQSQRQQSVFPKQRQDKDFSDIRKLKDFIRADCTPGNTGRYFRGNDTRQKCGSGGKRAAEMQGNVKDFCLLILRSPLKDNLFFKVKLVTVSWGVCGIGRSKRYESTKSGGEKMETVVKSAKCT